MEAHHLQHPLTVLTYVHEASIDWEGVATARGNTMKSNA